MFCASGDLKLGEKYEAAIYKYDERTGLLEKDFSCKHHIFVDWGSHKEGNKVVSFSCGFCPTTEDSQWDIMGDGTLVDRKNPDLVLGIRQSDGMAVLVNKNDPCKCIFAAFMEAPGQASMTQVVGNANKVQDFAGIKVHDAVTWTDAEDPFLGMIMEDNDVPRGAFGKVIAIDGDSAQVRFGPAEVDVKMSCLRKVETPGAPAQAQSAALPVQQPPPASVAAPVQHGTVTIEVPPNAAPGAVIQAQAPTGEILQITVPAGSQPGSHLTVQY